MDQKLLTKNQFAFYLSDQPKGSVLMLGDVDTHYYTGAINKVSLTNETYFEFKLDGFKSDGKQYVNGNSARAICDSGTSLIAGPMDVMDDCECLLLSLLLSLLFSIVLRKTLFPILRRIFSFYSCFVFSFFGLAWLRFACLCVWCPIQSTPKLAPFRRRPVPLSFRRAM